MMKSNPSSIVCGLIEATKSLGYLRLEEIGTAAPVLFKYADFILYSLGIVNMIKGCSEIIYGVTHKDMDTINSGANSLLHGLGQASWGMGDYIDRVNIGKPPKRKTKKISERIKEKLEELLPQPSPAPIPVERHYSSLENYVR